MVSIAPKILVPTDFSALSDNAFSFAIQLAKKIAAEVVVVHAYHFSDPEARLAPVEVLEDIHSSRREDAVLRFEAYRQQAEKENFSLLRMEPLIRKGFAGRIILETAAMENPSLIVMGCRGHSRSWSLLGNVTLKVIREAVCPVLAVPEKAVFKPIRQIAFATDFKEKQSEMGRQLIQFSKYLDATLCGVHVRKSTDMPPKVVWGKYPGDKWLAERPLFWIQGPDTVTSLLHFIKRQEIDMLSIISHHHSLLEDLVQPGVTYQLAQRLEIPLLAFHE